MTNEYAYLLYIHYKNPCVEPPKQTSKATIVTIGMVGPVPFVLPFLSLHSEYGEGQTWLLMPVIV